MDPSTELTLDQAIATPITEPIPSPITDRLLASPPFISIPGLFNARDLSDVTQPASNIRPAYIYRSGSLEKLTEEEFYNSDEVGAGKYRECNRTS